MCSKKNQKDLNVSIFNKITGINESKPKYISCKYECKFDGRCNSNQKWNNNKCRCERKNPKQYNMCEKDYIQNPATCSCENGKYIGSIIDDSLIMSDEIIDTIPMHFNGLMKKGNL